MDTLLRSAGWWLLWQVTFVGFPIGGGLAYLIFKTVDGPFKGILAGAFTGLVLGTIQWLVLRQRGIDAWWIVATGCGLACGLALSIALIGTANDALPVLYRGAIAGLIIGLAQWFILRNSSPYAFWWILIMTGTWAIGWTVTRMAGVDLSYGWSVFGALGALTFTVITGLFLLILLR